MQDGVPAPVQRAPHEEQIRAILSPEIFSWAVKSLPEGVDIDDVRYRDLISVSENDVVRYVASYGFDDRRVAEDAVFDDRICIVNSPQGWRVFYTERGSVSDESVFATKADAKREVVRRLMSGARISLNHRYWHAHDLAFPCDVE